MKRLRYLLILVLLPVMVYHLPLTVRGMDCSAKAAIVMDAATGFAFYEKNADEKLPMASTTKIMTALLTLEQENLDTYFEVDENAIKVEGSSMGLMSGDKVSLRALAYGMLLASGNDAANAAAVRISGSIPAFVDLMNRRAAELGLNSTHFVTPSGLHDEAHYSSARDLAVLARAALKNPDFAEICSSASATISYGNPPYARRLTNHNRLLRECEGVIGVKTGFTKAAGRCLVSACTRNGGTLICVTLHAPDDWQDHTSFYDTYFADYREMPLPQADTEFSLPVIGGTADTATASPSGADTVWLPVKVEGITSLVYLPRFCYAPVKAGSVVGEIRYFYHDEEIAVRPIIAKTEITMAESGTEKPKKGFWQSITEFFKRLF